MWYPLQTDSRQTLLNSLQPLLKISSNILFSTNLHYTSLALALDKGKGQGCSEEEMAVNDTEKREKLHTVPALAVPPYISVRVCRCAYGIAGLKGVRTVITTPTRGADGGTLGWQQLASLLRFFP